MTKRTDNAIDRREMGRTALRWMLGCGIAGTATVLCTRKGGSAPQACGLASCRGCGAIAECSLPQAIASRRTAR